MFSQHSSGQLFSAEDVGRRNPHDQTALTYSIMDKLNQFKSSSGSWHFKLCYPELTSVQDPPCNEWTQTSNPSSTTIQSFQIKSGAFPEAFRGLGKNGRATSTITVMDSTTTTDKLWYSIGVKQLTNGKIAGPRRNWVDQVELYVKKPENLPQATGRKKRESLRNDIFEKWSSRSRVVKRAAEAETDLEFAQRSYGSQLRYQCGPARRFLDEDTEEHYDERWLQCNWNKTWTRTDTLDVCDWVQCLNPPEVSAMK